MKQIFPILISIIAITLVLVITMNKKSKPWSEMNQSEKKIKLIQILAGFVVLIFGVVTFIFIIK